MGWLKRDFKRHIGRGSEEKKEELEINFPWPEINSDGILDLSIV